MFVKGLTLAMIEAFKAYDSVTVEALDPISFVVRPSKTGAGRCVVTLELLATDRPPAQKPDMLNTLRDIKDLCHWSLDQNLFSEHFTVSLE